MGEMRKIDLPQFGNGDLFLDGRRIGKIDSLTVSPPNPSNCGHHYVAAPDLFEAGKREKFRCIHCKDVI